MRIISEGDPLDLAALTIGRRTIQTPPAGISPVADRDALTEALEHRNLAHRQLAAGCLRFYGAHVLSTAFLPPSCRFMWTAVDDISTVAMEINGFTCLQASTAVYAYALSRR